MEVNEKKHAASSLKRNEFHYYKCKNYLHEKLITCESDIRIQELNLAIKEVKSRMTLNIKEIILEGMVKPHKQTPIYLDSTNPIFEEIKISFSTEKVNFTYQLP